MKMHDITEITEHKRDLIDQATSRGKPPLSKLNTKELVDAFIGLHTYLYTKSNIDNYYSP